MKQRRWLSNEELKEKWQKEEQERILKIIEKKQWEWEAEGYTEEKDNKGEMDNKTRHILKDFEDIIEQIKQPKNDN